MKKAVQRVVYDNYDLWGDYHEEAREFLEEWHNPDEISESMIWDEIYRIAGYNWLDEKERLTGWLVGYRYMMRGYVGRWNGTSFGGLIFTDFDDAFREATCDCDYWKIWDENGHLFLKCSHHDGTNLFEIKRLTGKGHDLLDRWENDWDDPRSEEEIHTTIWNSNFYSALPHFAHNVYGCKKKEYKNEQ